MKALPLLKELLASKTSRISGSAVAVIFVLLAVVLFIVPVPSPLLDLLITLNLVISLLLLVSAVISKDPGRMQAFPAVLLLTTLYRLSLNVSSTRLILLYGHQSMHAAGRVIESFGQFVVQGDFVVGGIVFAIIAIVNFLVVTKGSARVAEVSARFTLDALPGKQLAIDSELRSGNISKEEARRRRQELERESSFFGSMDGAMRFVQGDAIAGFIIVFINSVGGVSLGLQRGMSFSDALASFGVLTVGDGLVNLVPSLMISVCAGIVVTHAAGKTRAPRESAAILHAFTDPAAARAAAGAVLALGVLTRFPLIPALVICAPLLILAEFGKSAVRRGEEEQGAVEFSAVDGQAGPRLLLSTAVRPIEIRMGKAIDQEFRNLSIKEPKWLEAALEKLRLKIFRSTGILPPTASLECDLRLLPNEYQIYIRERLASSGRLPLGAFCVKLPPASVQAFALALVQPGPESDPLDSVPCSWVAYSPELPRFLARLGTDGRSDVEQLLFEALSITAREPECFFGVEETKAMLAEVRQAAPALVEEALAPGVLTAPELAELLRRLLRERVSIRDLKLILEGVIEYSSTAGKKDDRKSWLAELHVFIRRVLANQIIRDALQPDGEFRAFVIADEIEEELLEALRSWEGERSKPPLDPNIERRLLEKIDQISGPVLQHGASPIVLLCQTEVRAALQEFLRARDSGRGLFRAIAFEELHGQSIKPHSLGVIEI